MAGSSDPPVIFTVSETAEPSKITVASGGIADFTGFDDVESNFERRERNPKFERMRVVTVACYCVVLVCALVAGVAYTWFVCYTVFPLKLSITGNQWTFVMMLIIATAIFTISLTIVSVAHSAERSLKWQHMLVCDILMVAFFLVTFLGYSGTAETVVDESPCDENKTCLEERKIAPLSLTLFGKYIQQYCAKYSEGIREPNFKTDIIEIYRVYKYKDYVRVSVDAEKCAKTDELRTAIYQMPYWYAMLPFIMIIELSFGVGGSCVKNIPEYID